MTHQEIKALLKKYEAGQCTPEEVVLVESWYLHAAASETFAKGQPDFDQYKKRIYPHTQNVSSLLWFRRFLPYVAAILLAAAIAFYFFDAKTSKQPVVQADIAPGYNQATLTLADGSKIHLDTAQSGIDLHGEAITYGNGAEIADLKEGKRKEEAIQQLQLSTPKGGQYQVILSDGSKVWLNSASTLTYPSKFAGDERVVEISGEGYFQIAPRKDQAFIVRNKDQEISVIGTEFNVSAYEDEALTETTLVQGAVRVSSQGNAGMQLSPGQQAISRDGKITVKSAEVQAATAWKLGHFYFKNTPFDDVMRQLARWYNVEVIYKNGVPKESFSGEMKRDLTLLTVLDFLKGSGIDFEVVGRQLVIH